MRCPYCNAENSRVVDSRPSEDGNSIRRRRQCDECGRRFTTYEKIENIPLMVIKKDNNREIFNRDKIVEGLMRACHKRPVSPDDISAAADRVEAAVYASEDKEVSSHDIGELVMEELKNLDEVAYVRFASVYREFRDVNTFLEELEKLYRSK